MSKLVTAWFNEATQEYFTPKVRMVYPALLEAKINRKYPNNPPKFSATGLVPKSANIEALQNAVVAFAKGLYGENWKDKDPPVKLPIKKTASNDKLAEYAEEYPYFLRMSANADFPPVLFGADLKPARREASEVYGGRWAVFALNIWGPKPEAKDVNRFVSLGINRVQLLDHDEQIATGRIQSADGFEAASAGSAPAGAAAGGKSADALWD